METYTDSAQYLTLLSRVDWLVVPGFEIGDFEGYRDFQFGCLAGSSNDLENVLHEISHSIELTNTIERLAKYNFGLTISTVVDIPGYPRFDEPASTQATERECRVIAIHKRLAEAMGDNTDGFFEYWADILKYSPDSVVVEYKQDGMVAKLKWMAAAYNEFTIDKIEKRWNMVMNFINKHS